MKHNFPKKTVVFLSLVLLIAITSIGGSIVYARTANSYPTTVSEPANSWTKNYSKIIMTCTNDGTFDFDTATSVSLVSQKTVSTSVAVPYSFIMYGYTIDNSVYILNNSGIESRTGSSTTFVANPLTGYYNSNASASLSGLAWGKETKHTVKLYYFTDDDSIKGADIYIRYAK